MPQNSCCLKIFFVCIFLSGCTECKTNGFYPNIKYFFLQNVSLSPNQKTYKKFDTIKFEIFVQGKRLFDTISKTEVGTDSISLPLSIYVYNLNTGQPAAKDGYFNFVDSNGQKLLVDTMNSYISHGFTFSTTTVCTNSPDYTLKIGMVVKDTGVYTLNVGGASVNPCLFTNSPPSSYSYIDYYLNLTEFNEDVFNSVPQNLRREGGYDFGTKKLFVFRVTE